MPNGINIEEWMLDSLIIFKDGPWCKVFHQLTENFIIGIFIAPTIVINELTLIAVLFSEFYVIYYAFYRVFMGNNCPI